MKTRKTLLIDACRQVIIQQQARVHLRDTNVPTTAASSRNILQVVPVQSRRSL